MYQVQQWAGENVGTREKKSSICWPHSDNKPGKSRSLELFHNTPVYTGGGWVKQDMQESMHFVTPHYEY